MAEEKQATVDIVKKYATTITAVFVMMGVVIGILTTVYIMPKVDMAVKAEIKLSAFPLIEGELLKQDTEYIKKSIDEVRETLKIIATQLIEMKKE